MVGVGAAVWWRLGPQMLMNGTCLLICVARPEENAAICSWMYMRKVSEDHRPCFWMVSRSAPLSLIAIAPPARREWLLTSQEVKPADSRPKALMAVLTLVLMSVARMCFACFLT